MKSNRLPTVLALIALATFGCQEPRAGPDEASTVTLLTPLGENVLSPYGGFTAQFLVFNPLVRRGEEGKMEGLLARSWEHDPATNTWTVHLRTDVLWHDGAPFTSRDVEFTMSLYSHPEIMWLPPDAYELEVLDDSTYTITAHTSLSFGTPNDFWIVYYPRHLLVDEDPAEFTEWHFWRSPVGTGPYRHVRTEPLTMVELEANPQYFGGEPAIQRVRLKLGGETLPELLSGAVDGAPYVPWQDVGKLLEDPRQRIYYNINHHETTALVWNHRHSALADATVRQALTMAIDRRALMGLLHLPAETPVLDVPPTDEQIREERFPERWPCDPQRAGAMLDEAGWRDADGNGVRERGGEELALSFLVPADEEETAAVFVQDQLGRVGVRVEIERRDALAIFERVQVGDFDAVVFLITSHLHGGEQDISHLYGPDSPIGYRNPAIVELLERAIQTGSPEARASVYPELAPLLEADLPITPLYPRVWNWVVHERIRGLSNGRMYDPLWNMEDLWIEREE
jgi:peptide/nickel transport system substrate-binding protein